ncbi:hypothetical protein ASD68_15830 [Rhodanobacter sp. Root627]|uniref:filamentous hemagglutinin N-terminal domain-containing protein n=1 Tax=Rhodanobacter sp. Root627 TaxID=1736572 RepID=UPI000701DE1E|nr:filamentous hemagglutinin N-terminal domain-containing protein [Rhodanobacter sp. Root627]KRA30305.1 hypothetical protein ASD68_15830 [Rhodanobacter sp. Root627]
MNNTIDAKTRGAHAATLPPHAGRLRRKLLPVSLSLLLVSPFVFGGEAMAAAVGATTGPTGGTVVGGVGSITQNGANTVINQNSAKLALDWQTFNVGKDASVKFNQPSFNAVALNRILDQNPSQIFGHISSNGQVFLINTHGIIFGASAQMNVGGLMASTLDLTPKDFLASRYNLDAHGANAGIVNHGLIKAASGGSVSLVGGSVANDGVILANYGRINLDGADRAVLDFDGNGLINIQVTGELKQRLDNNQAAVTNKGTLKADSGTVVLQASAAKDLFTNLVNNSGVIDAGGISTQGGVVRLVAAGGNTENSGAINVTGAQGGSVQLLSDQNVSVTGNVDASGSHGGGSIRVGGGYQGGEGLQAAAVTYVGPDARLNADALQSGDGGSVVLWSNTATGFKGNISARGGAAGGNGGMAEVSSRGYLAFDGSADLRAPHGAWGTLLLDPNDITISDDPNANPATLDGFDASGVFTPGDATAASTINTGTIVAQLGSSDVNIKTTDGNITVVNGFTYNGENDRTLTLDAAGTLTFKTGATIESTGGTGGTHTLGGVLTGTSGVVFEGGSSFITNGGDLAVNGGAFTLDGALDAGAGTVTLDSSGAIGQTSGVITAGTLTGSSTGATTLGEANQIGTLGDFSAASLSLTNSTALTIAGNIVAGDAGDPVGPPVVLPTGGSITLSSGGIITQDAGSSISSNGGDISLTGSAVALSGTLDASNSDTTGDVTLTSTAGGLSVEDITGDTVTLEATGGGITQTDGVITAATLTGSTTGDATLNRSTNVIAKLDDFSAASLLLANNTALTIAGNVVAGDATGTPVVPGNITLSSGGVITQEAGSSLSSNGGDISITGSATGPGSTLILDGTLDAGTGGVSLTTDAGDLSLGGAVTGATVTLTANGVDGAIKQTAGSITATGGNVTLNSAGGTQLGKIEAGSLTVTAGGITQLSGAGDALLVSGTSSFDAGAHAITLDNTSNHFTGAVSLTNSDANAVTLNNGGNALVLGDVQVGSGTLTVSGVGITQATGSTITQAASAGAVQFNAGAGVLQLDKANTFTGAVSLANSDANAVTLNNGADALVLGDVHVGSGTLTVSGVGITQATGSTITQAASAGAAQFNAGAGVLQLGNANAFTGAVSLKNSGANNVTLDNGTNALVLGDVQVGSGALTVTGVGITQATGSTITQAAGAGAAQFDAGAGVLQLDKANTFTGAVGLTNSGANDVTLNNGANALVLGDVQVGSGALTVTGVGITQATGSTITQAAGAGAAQFNAGAGVLQLDKANTFTGAVGLTNSGANDVTLNNGANALELGDVQVGSGTLTVSGVGITQAAGSTITQVAGAGAAQFNAGAGVLQLDKANTFTGAVGLTNSGANDVTLNNGSNALVLGDVQVGSGTLTVSGTGITQAVGSTITQAASAGAAQFDAGVGALQLANANTFTGAVSLKNSGANNVTLNNGANALTLGTSTLGSGTFNLTGTGQTTLAGNLSTSGGAIALSGPITLGAASTGVDTTDGGSVAAGAAITFNGAVNGASTLTLNAGTGGTVTLGGAVGAATTLTGLDVTAGSFSANTLNIGTGGLAVTTRAGDITQGGAFTVTGASSFDAGAHAIALANTNNHFTGAVSLANSDANDVTLNNGANALELGDVQVGSGALTVSGVGITQATGSTITQEASAGAAQFNAGAGVLQLDNANTLTGAVSLKNSGANDVTLDNGSNALVLGDVQIGSGALTVLGVGITQAVGSTITQAASAGAAQFNADAGVLQLDNANTFTGAVSLNNSGANNVTLNNGANALALGTSTLGSGTFNLTGTGQTTLAGNLSTSGGAIILSGPVTLGAASTGVDTTGGGSVTTGAAITFNGAVDGASTLTLNAGTGGAVTLGGAVGAATTLTGLDVTAGSFSANTLNIGTGGLSVATQASDITQGGAFTVTGASSFDAGAHAITLANTNNHFTGAVSLTNSGANAVALNNGSNALELGDVQVGSGTLTVSGTGITQATGSTITQAAGAGAAQFNAGAGVLQLDSANTFTGAVSLNNSGNHDVTLDNGTHALTLGTSTLGSGAFSLEGSGQTTLAGNLTTTGGAITLSGSVALGSPVTGIYTTGGGATTGAAITFDGALDGASGLTLDAGTTGLVTLGGVVGNTTALTSLTVTAGSFSANTLNIGSGGLSVTTQAGDIMQSGTGAFTVVGTSDFTAMNGHEITLEAANNDFQGSVKATGTGVSITDTNDLTIDTLTNGTDGTVSLIAGGALLLPTGSIDTGAADLTLEANGGTLVAPGVLSGANVTLSSQGDITLSKAVTATGTLSLTSLAGAIGQSLTGNLTAAVLTGSSSGSTLLDGTNHIASLGNFSASGFSLTNSQGLSVSGVVDGGSSAALTTTSGNLTVGGRLKGTTVTLTSAGAIDEGGTSTGVIEAGTLTGTSQGDTLLDGANLVDTLGSFSAANFTLVNNQGLAANGPLTTTGGTGSISLKTTTGALSLGSDLSGGAISLESADDLVLAKAINGSTVELISSGGGISQSAGVITAGTLSGHAADSVALNLGNRVVALGNFDADGFSLTNDAALAVNGVVDGGSSTTLTTTTGNLTVNGTLKGTAVTLSSAGGIGEGAAGVIEADTLAGHSQGDTLLGGANLVDTLNNFDATNFSFVNAQDLAVSGPLATGAGAGSISLKTSSGTLSVNDDLVASAVALTSADGLTLTHNINATAVSLAAGGNISQSAGVITAGTLTGQSTGTTTLGLANHVGTLGSFKAANFSLVNDAGLSVNGPLQITSPNGGVSLRTTSGILTVNSVLSAGAVSLDSAGNLALAHEVSGGLVTLKSGGNISQTASGTLTATTLTGSSTGSTTLNGSGNKIGTLGSFTAAGFSLTNSQSLSVAGPVNGGASTSLATTAGNLAINGAVNGTTTAFNVAGNITQGAGGVITAATLRGTAGGAVALGGNNQIDTLGDFSAAGFSLKNARDLTVAGTVNGGSSAGLATTGNLIINGTLTGATTTLDVTGAISEASAGSIVAGRLNGDTTGAVSLTGNNRIGALGDFSAAYLNLGNAQALTVAGTVDGGTSTTLTTTSGDLTINGALKGTAMTLDSAGAINEGSQGVITAATLTGRSTGITALNGANRVGTLGSFDAAGFDFTNAQALSANGPLTIANGGRLHLTTSSGVLSVNSALRGGDVGLSSASDLTLTQAVQGDTVTLVSGGNISQTASGIVTAGTLAGRSVGSTMLDPVNHVDALGSFSANGFDLASDRTLTVIGPVDGGDHVNLITTNGDIIINGLVSGTRTTLSSAGAINQGSAGGIAASTLSGSSTGATTLEGGGNRVATLEAFKAAGFSFTNGQSLIVAGPIDGGARTTLTTTRGGDLSIDGAVQGGMMTLVSAGAINEGASGSLTADTLTGSATGMVMLGDAAHPLANYIGTLGGFSAPAGFSLTNAQTLTLASVNGSGYTVDAGTSSTYLSVVNGDLLQADQAWLYNGAGVWASTGHMGVGGAPIYVTGVDAQVIVPGGISPAYFYAVDRQGNILPLTGGSSINVPTSALTSRAQNTNKHTDSYIDSSVISANYRAFGIVPSGLLLPPDQQRCAPDAMDCDDE